MNGHMRFDIEKAEQIWTAKGFTTKSIAEALGIKPSTLRKKITGERSAMIDADQLAILSLTVGVSSSEFYS